MMQPELFISLVAYACATTFSPGPNNVLLLSSAGLYGAKKCMPLVLGIWTGLLTVMLICGFGCSFLGDLVPQVAPYAKYVGAVYITYLGYMTLTKKPPTGDTSDKTKNTPLTYVHGFLLQFLNVKILMLGIAAYTSFILPNDTAWLPTLIFSITMAVSAACGNLIWLTVGSLLLPLYRRYYRVFNIIMALLLAWCVFKIIM